MLPLALDQMLFWPMRDLSWVGVRVVTNSGVLIKYTKLNVLSSIKVANDSEVVPIKEVGNNKLGPYESPSYIPAVFITLVEEPKE